MTALAEEESDEEDENGEEEEEEEEAVADDRVGPGRRIGATRESSRVRLASNLFDGN
jgi:hypothetical protein